MISVRYSSKVLGIDFGTANSVACVYSDKKSCFALHKGNKLIPSPVLMGDKGPVPLKSLLSNPKAYGVIEENSRLYWDSVKGRIDVIFEIAQALRSLRRASNIANQANLHNCIMSVPANFNELQKKWMLQAATEAGLKVIKIFVEPTAAILSQDISEPGVYGIYDLGSGTCDFSVARVFDKDTVQILGTVGLNHVGGNYWDKKLLDKYNREHNSECSLESITKLRETGIGKNLDRHFVEHFDEHLQAECEEMLSESVRMCLELVQSLKVKLKKVICIGGMSKMPMVTQALKILGHIQVPEDGQTCVAVGLAKHGDALRHNNPQLLLDAAALSVGVESTNGLVDWIIQRGAPLPYSNSMVFTNYQGNQVQISFNIVQGVSSLVEDCRSLGKFAIKIPPSPPNSVKIEVKIELDQSGMILVTATNLDSGAMTTLDLEGKADLIEIEAMVSKAETQTREEKHFRQACREIDSLLHSLGDKSPEFVEARRSVANLSDAEALLNQIRIEFENKFENDLILLAQKVYNDECLKQ